MAKTNQVKTEKKSREINKNLRLLLILFISSAILLFISHCSGGNSTPDGDPSVGRRGTAYEKVLEDTDSTTVVSVFFPHPVHNKNRGGEILTVPGAGATGKAGEPEIPGRNLLIAIPEGKEIAGIEVETPGSYTMDGRIEIAPVQCPVPIGYNKKIEVTQPDSQIYSKDENFPDSLYKTFSIQKSRGYKLLPLYVYPLQWNPVTKTAVFNPRINLYITWKDTYTKGVADKNYRGFSDDKKRLSHKVVNPQALDSYDVLPTRSVKADYQYIIITDAVYVTDFADLLQHRITHGGLSGKIITVAHIETNYSGDDTQDKIRNCIKDYYQNYGTEYVLLGGDADGENQGGESEDPIVPCRSLYDSSETIPSDVYYGCLDGDFNHDNDSYYGEYGDGETGGEIDLFAEVYVGRAPVDSTTEVQNFVSKVIAYETSTDSYLSTAYMLGEQLDSNTYGDDYKEEVRYPSSANGYSTAGLSQSFFLDDMNTLYEKEADWGSSDIISALNSNIHIINHMGHANVNYALQMNNAQVDALTNTKYTVIYTQGCYCGSFDNRGEDPTTYYNFDCILEHLVTQSNGAVAVLGNSRYGWYNPGGTNGPSQVYDRQFWNAFLEFRYTSLGEMLTESREYHYNAYGNYIRWCYFSVNLLGDPYTQLQVPTIPLKPDNPSAQAVSSNQVNLAWEDSADDEDNYIIERKTGKATYTELATLTAGSTSYSDDSCSEGTTYTYRIIARNTDGEGISDTITVTTPSDSTPSPTPSSSPTSTSTGGSGGGGGGGCFIATATYGTPMAKEVQSLRIFRDKYLLTNLPGRKFVEFYYKNSPPVADSIRSNPTTKGIMRVCLFPLTVGVNLLIYHPFAFWLLASLLLLCMIWIGFFIRKRKGIYSVLQRVTTSS